MKRLLCAVTALCLLLAGVPAIALTGEEALGLVNSDNAAQNTNANYPTLQKGMMDGDDAGAYVVMLQNRLAELGYMLGSADGTFGSMTESALINFQAENGLTPTGIADNITQTMLYSTAAKRAPTQGQGEENDVFLVQQLLARWGFLESAPDGVAGTSTETAVAEFKSYISTNPIYAAYAASTPEPVATLAPGEQPIAVDTPIKSTVEVNGQTGEITDQVLKFVNGEYPFQVYQTTLQSGSSGPEVWRVQRRLRQLKYLYKPDGSYGSLTVEALKYFQRKNGLTETGIADEATQTKLFSIEAIPSEEYVFPYRITCSLDQQRVYIYGWDGAGYTKEIGSCRCSTGQPGYETPKGIYQSGGKCTYDEWYYFTQYDTYAKYATRIVGGVLFHSVLYNNNKQGPTRSSVNSLGRPVSHGCVRLPEENAKWIFENCPEGTTIEIY